MAVAAKKLYEAVFAGLEKAVRSALAGELGFAVRIVPDGPPVEALWDGAPLVLPPVDALAESGRVRVVDRRPFPDYSRVARGDLRVGRGGERLSVVVEAELGRDVSVARPLSPRSAERAEAFVAAGFERGLRDARALQTCATLWLSHRAHVVVQEDGASGCRMRVDISLAPDSAARLLDETTEAAPAASDPRFSPE